MESVSLSDTVLVLHLKRVWFEMISSGVKHVEYRDLLGYWEKFNDGLGGCCYWDVVLFGLGYPSYSEPERWCAFRLSFIDIGLGRKEWGAIPGVRYWRIHLGDRLDCTGLLSYRSNQ